MKKLLMCMGLFLLMASQSAFAGLMGVSKIVISPSSLNNQGWLQVSEVIATQTGSGDDVALSSVGATAVGSSDWPTSSASYAIDGEGPSAFSDIFHSNENNGSSFLNIFLASPSELDSITLFGRTDCCSERDIYDLALFDVNNELIFQASDLSADNLSHSVSIALPSSVDVPVTSPLILLSLILCSLGFVRRNN